jgi:hypothetical protein
MMSPVFAENPAKLWRPLRIAKLSRYSRANFIVCATSFASATTTTASGSTPAKCAFHGWLAMP